MCWVCRQARPALVQTVESEEDTIAEHKNQLGFCRFKVGEFDAVALHEGTGGRPRPDGFVANAPDAEVGEAHAQIGLPRDKVTVTFTVLLLDTGSQRILFDAGNGEAAASSRPAGRLVANLAAAGYAPADIDHVLISHFHGDHIAGLLAPDDTLAFPKAKVHVPRAEWAFWTSAEERSNAPERLHATFDATERIFGIVGDRRAAFDWGDEVLPGITAMRAEGHTPGHTGFDITSAGDRMMYVADITNNPLVYARNPDWQASWDVLPDVAVETRKRILGQAADERLRLFFYHAPFPSNGYVLRSSDGGYQFVPALWE